MKKLDIEIAVGIFIFIGLVCMAYTSVKLGKVDFLSSEYYPVKATFTTVRGLKVNTDVEISGVDIGRVEDVELKDYNAVVTMLIKKGVKLQDDAIASIRTHGILGQKYIEILPGGSDVIIESGGVLFDTEPPLDLESLIKNFVMQN